MSGAGGAPNITADRRTSRHPGEGRGPAAAQPDAGRPDHGPTSGGVEQQSFVSAALRGACPRCGARTLFNGLATFAPRCRACALDFAAFNVGDGPAAFLILAIGALVTALAIWLELAAGPPFWLHVLVWPPVALAAVVGSLRIAKAALLALEYKNGAREGRIAGGG